MKTMNKRLQRAFTITELVIVIAVIAILAAVLIPTFSSVISSARESAAMQECNNARTVYMNEHEGSLEDGLVFVNNDYAYVEFSGQLHLLGKLEDLTNINVDAKVEKKDSTKDIANGVFEITEPTGTAAKVEIAIGDETASDVTPEAGRKVYFYTVTVNNTTYVGYFRCPVSLDEATKINYAIDNTWYSDKIGYVATNASVKMTVTATSVVAGG